MENLHSNSRLDVRMRHVVNQVEVFELEFKDRCNFGVYPHFRESHGLDRTILKSGNAAPEEVEHVREALWKHARTIYGAFDYFAAVMSENLDTAGP